jgi:DNA-binding transcriptional LysR family regulator
MLKNISLDYYKIFYEVARELNITRASEKLLISQPAVTQTINKLEEQLNTQLFIRQSRGLMLTKMGELLFDEVKQALVHFQLAERLVEEEENLLRGEIVIGCGTHLAKTLLVEPITTFHLLYPKVNIKILDKSSSLMLKELALGQIDLVIGQNKTQPTKQIVFRPLLQEQYVFVCHKNYLQTVHLSADSFQNKHLQKVSVIVGSVGSSVRAKFDQINTQQHFNLTPQIEVAGHNMSIALVKNKVGVGFLPEYLIKDEINSGEFLVLPMIKKEQNNAEYGCFTNIKTISKATKEFLKLLQ